MTKKEMVRNLWNLLFVERAIPPFKLRYNMSLDDLNGRLRNSVFNRFVREVVTDSELCGVSPMNSRKFALDFIQNSGYVKTCITATINLIQNGEFSKKWQLDGFLDKLLWVHVVKACHEKLNNNKNIPIDMI